MYRIVIHSDWGSREFTKILNPANIPRIGEIITTKDLEGSRRNYRVVNIEHSLDLIEEEKIIYIQVKNIH